MTTTRDERRTWQAEASGCEGLALCECGPGVRAVTLRWIGDAEKLALDDDRRVWPELLAEIRHTIAQDDGPTFHGTLHEVVDGPDLPIRAIAWIEGDGTLYAWRKGESHGWEPHLDIASDELSAAIVAAATRECAS